MAGFKLDRTKLKSTIKAKMEGVSEDYIGRLVSYTKPRVKAATEDWRWEIRKLLSVRFPPSRKKRNRSEYPRMVSGVLERSLHYRQRVEHSKHSMRVSVYRKFEDNSPSQYITKLNSYRYPTSASHPFAGQYATFAGYQERVYVRLSKRMDEVFDRIYGHVHDVMLRRAKG